MKTLIVSLCFLLLPTLASAGILWGDNVRVISHHYYGVTSAPAPAAVYTYTYAAPATSVPAYTSARPKVNLRKAAKYSAKVAKYSAKAAVYSGN